MWISLYESAKPKSTIVLLITNTANFLYFLLSVCVAQVPLCVYHFLCLLFVRSVSLRVPVHWTTDCTGTPSTLAAGASFQMFGSGSLSSRRFNLSLLSLSLLCAHCPYHSLPLFRCSVWITCLSIASYDFLLSVLLQMSMVVVWFRSILSGRSSTCPYWYIQSLVLICTHNILHACAFW